MLQFYMYLSSYLVCPKPMFRTWARFGSICLTFMSPELFNLFDIYESQTNLFDFYVSQGNLFCFYKFRTNPFGFCALQDNLFNLYSLDRFLAKCNVLLSNSAVFSMLLGFCKRLTFLTLKLEIWINTHNIRRHTHLFIICIKNLLYIMC